MTYHNKLVRDKIPHIITNNGQRCQTHILLEEAFADALTKKLQEEVEEYIENPSVEELADILEVVTALAQTLNVSFEHVESMRQKKAHERGAFKDRIFLEWVA